MLTIYLLSVAWYVIVATTFMYRLDVDEVGALGYVLGMLVLSCAAIVPVFNAIAAALISIHLYVTRNGAK